MESAADELSIDRVDDERLIDASNFRIRVASARTPAFSSGRITSIDRPVEGGRHARVLLTDSAGSTGVSVEWSIGRLHLTPSPMTGYGPVDGGDFQANWFVARKGVFRAGPSLDEASGSGLADEETRIYREVSRVVRSVMAPRQTAFERDFHDLPALLVRIDEFVAEVPDGPWTNGSLLVVGVDPRGSLVLHLADRNGTARFPVNLARAAPGDLVTALAQRGITTTVDCYSAGLEGTHG